MSNKHCSGLGIFRKVAGTVAITVEEIWKDVLGYEGYYQVSNKSAVKSLARIVPMSDGRSYRVKEKLLKHAWNGNYFHVILSKAGKERTLLHHLILESFVGPRPEGMEACHNDGNAKNNHVSNLRWDTQLNNARDRVNQGHTVLGWVENSYKMVGKTEEIKRLRATGLSLAKPAKTFDVTTPTIIAHLKKGVICHVLTTSTGRA